MFGMGYPLHSHGAIIGKLDDDQTCLYRVQTGVRSQRIISESGLYKLIMRSDKPQAREFQDWVTKEVLPSIRKTGSYSLQPGQAMPLPTSMADALRGYAQGHHLGASGTLDRPPTPIENQPCDKPPHHTYEWKKAERVTHPYPHLIGEEIDARWFRGPLCRGFGCCQHASNGRGNASPSVSEGSFP